MNIIKEVENILKEANLEEYKKEAQILITEISGLRLEDIILDKPVKNKDEIIKLTKKRAQDRIPLQHLIGYSYFMGDKYKVNKNVLIPRDETEELVLKAYELVKNKKNKIDILDIGIGSGCISCALAKKLFDKDIEILGVDISSDALITALENINALNLERKVIVRKSDLFSKIRPQEKFDLIVSNPPYIPINQKPELQIEVRAFEPELALFAQDIDGIDFYKRIIKDAPYFLKSNGILAFEAGENQADKIKELLKDDFKDIEITTDINNIERVITAIKK